MRMLICICMLMCGRTCVLVLGDAALVQSAVQSVIEPALGGRVRHGDWSLWSVNKWSFNQCIHTPPSLNTKNDRTLIEKINLSKTNYNMDSLGSN